jgi:cytochrome c peroxidase
VVAHVEDPFQPFAHPEQFFQQIGTLQRVAAEKEPFMRNCWTVVCALSLGACAGMDEGEQLGVVEADIKNNKRFENSFGASTTWSTLGFVDLRTAFDEDLGANGRTCGSCHKPGEGMAVSAESVRAVFEATSGLDPIFRTNDGSNSPDADVSTLYARRAAYSMLLSRGVIRVGLPIPAGAEFELVAVDDPYGFASANELSLFRRPLPSANLTLIPRVMWDGRVIAETIPAALALQSNGATQGHAARPDPIDEATRQEIVAHEVGLFNAQLVDTQLGRLDRDGARGGAEALATQAFVASRFDLFDGWANSPRPGRRAVFRGQELFNTKTRPDGGGACRGCHSAENIGTNVNGTFFNVGASAGIRRAPDQPLYTLRRIATGEEITTTDPGRALITGLWADMDRFKTPSLRGLAARAPYFHGGSADTLEEVIAFYEESLGFDFTPAEEADLLAFLSVL